MRAKTELFLYQCLWVADTLLRPSWRNLCGSFEEWAYRSGLVRQVQRLEADGFLETHREQGGTARVVRLTKKGFIKALGGREPEERWNRWWDGKWRIVFFDLPEEARLLRNEFRKQLKAAHFGGLQKSAWITPDPLEAVGDALKQIAPTPGVMTFFEGTPCGGESTEALVTSAWDFERINKAYEAHQKLLAALPSGSTKLFREKLLEWGQDEMRSWSRCMLLDPLLPRSLCPRDYQGEITWNKRIACLRRAAVLANPPRDI